jgi:long-subunit fatty acid transport protein
MRRVLAASGALALMTGAAAAGGVERSSQSVAILFEQGSYAELSFGRVSPNVSGNLAPPAPAIGSGDMAPGYNTVSLGYKTDLTDRISMALILDQPIGADVAYPSGTGYPAAGSTATIDATAVTGIVRYKMPSNFSVYGGIRAQTVSGEVALQPSGYTMSTSTETDYGWLVGVAYERPEIALRVALTYNSAIDHTFTVQENGGPSLPFTTTVPQSWNLEFQSGVAADTLVFGSIRYVDWTEFDITPVGYLGITGSSLVSYDDDTTTYTLGVGRRFNETWSGSLSFSHEAGTGPFSGNLGPTDGSTSVQVAAVYTRGPMKITGGLRYIDIGEAQTRLSPTTTTNFSGNHGWAAGLRIGYSF